MNYPHFLYDNVLRGITPTFSGTTLSGKTPANAVDWKDFSYFEADSGNLDYVVTEDTTIDAVSLYVATFTGTGAQSIELQYESAPATFTSLSTTASAGGVLTLTEFTPVTVLTGRTIRFVITVGTGSLLIRQLVVGEVLIAEQGQFKTVTVPTLLGGIKTSNVISGNGSVLGRSIKRVERMGKIDIENLTPSWVRSTFEPFAYHAAKFPFIYAWNPTTYPNEIAFTVVEKSITPPNHNGKGARLDMSWSVRHLIADSYAL